MTEQVTRRQVLERIDECEKAGEFDKHVDPVDYDIAIPVDGNFHYIYPPKLKLKYSLENIFMIKPYSLYIHHQLGTKIVGRENLKGIKSAIVTCNHVNKMDCLVVKKGMAGHKLYITAASFNNQKGLLGELMRAGGMLPFGETLEAMRNLNVAIEKYLKNDSYILFYPEQAMWWNYEKPRPYKNGAFHYAAKCNVPVIPTLITFKKTGTFDSEGIENKQFTLNILKPVFPKDELSVKENTEYLRNNVFAQVKQKYEEVYRKPLIYGE